MLVMITVMNMMTTKCHDYGCRVIMIIMVMMIITITVMVAAVAAVIVANGHLDCDYRCYIYTDQAPPRSPVPASNDMHHPRLSFTFRRLKGFVVRLLRAGSRNFVALDLKPESSPKDSTHCPLHWMK